jgi:RNA polymerase primary sigma factor
MLQDRQETLDDPPPVDINPRITRYDGSAALDIWADSDLDATEYPGCLHPHLELVEDHAEVREGIREATETHDLRAAVEFSIEHDFGNPKFELLQRILHFLLKTPEKTISILDIAEGLNESPKDERILQLIRNVLRRIVTLTAIPEYRNQYQYEITCKTIRTTGTRYQARKNLFSIHHRPNGKDSKHRERKLCNAPSYEDIPKVIPKNIIDKLEEETGMRVAEVSDEIKGKRFDNAASVLKEELGETLAVKMLEAKSIPRHGAAVWTIEVDLDAPDSKKALFVKLQRNTIDRANNLGFVVRLIERGYYAVIFFDEKDFKQKLGQSDNTGDNLKKYELTKIRYSKKEALSRKRQALNKYKDQNSTEGHPESLPQEICLLIDFIVEGQENGVIIKPAHAGKKLEQILGGRFTQNRIKKLLSLSVKHAETNGFYLEMRKDNALKIVLLKNEDTANLESKPTLQLQEETTGENSPTEIPDIIPVTKPPTEKPKRPRPLSSLRATPTASPDDRDSAYRKWMESFATLTPSEEIECIRKLKEEGDIEAGERLRLNNLKTIAIIALKYRGRGERGGLTLEDLMQEGTFGLERAIEKFDHKRGYQFNTYAPNWIERYISNAIENQGRTIRLPRGTFKLMNEIKQARKDLTEELGRFPNLEELAKACNIGVDRLKATIAHRENPLSIDLPVGENNDKTIGDCVKDQNSSNPEEETAESEKNATVRDVIEKAPLNEQERRVLNLRFGFGNNSGETLSLAQVGEIMGVTRERIRQIQVKALAKLKAFKEIQMLDPNLRAEDIEIPKRKTEAPTPSRKVKAKEKTTNTEQSTTEPTKEITMPAPESPPPAKAKTSKKRKRRPARKARKKRAILVSPTAKRPKATQTPKPDPKPRLASISDIMGILSSIPDVGFMPTTTEAPKETEATSESDDSTPKKFLETTQEPIPARPVLLETTKNIAHDRERAYLKTMTSHSILTKERELELARLIQEENNEAAKEELFLHNIRLVVDMARKFRWKAKAAGLSFHDIVQEGMFGLMKAVEKFDYKQGYKFSTYATWWIWQTIDRAIKNTGRVIHMPHEKWDLFMKTYGAKIELSKELGREASEEEVAEKCGITVGELKQLRKDFRLPSSTDEFVGDEKKQRKGDLIEDAKSRRPDQNIHRIDLQRGLFTAFGLARLSDRERDVIIMTFGMNGEGERQSQEIGPVLGASPSSIRNSLANGLRKLRNCEETQPILQELLEVMRRKQAAA